jgi:hypothetical protein
LELLAGTQLYGTPLAAIRELLQNAFDAVGERIARERLSQPDPVDPEMVLGQDGAALGCGNRRTDCEPMKHDDWVFSAQFSPDGQRVVTASEDQTARVWATGLGDGLRLGG